MKHSLKISNLSLRKHWPFRGRAINGYLFIAPAMFFMFSFILYPLLNTLYLSFTEYNFVYSTSPKFIGLGNYLDMFKDDRFYEALYRTSEFTLWFFPVLILFSLFVAILLNTQVRGWKLFQSLVFLPSVVPLSISGILFVWILDPQFGLFNEVLKAIGWSKLAQPWLLNPATAMKSIAGVSLWKYAGFNIILFLAGLQAIPEQLYESAKLDGASFWQEVLYISLPNIKETFITVSIWSIIVTLKSFTQMFVMTSGGPARATTVLYHYVYEVVFNFYNLGYGSALAYFLAICIFLVSVFSTKLVNRKGGQC
jgi:ABC-type sugar transport system permease subunit